MDWLSRRRFIVDGSRALIAIGLAKSPRPRPYRRSGDGRLAARPVAHPVDPLPPGEHVLWTMEGRDTIVIIPPNLEAGHPAPLMLALHGATQSSEFTVRAMRAA